MPEPIKIEPAFGMPVSLTPTGNDAIALAAAKQAAIEAGQRLTTIEGLASTIDGQAEATAENASLANTRAGDAESARTTVVMRADEVAANKTATDLARDAALTVAGPLHPDEATGRAAVADGAYFRVVGMGDVAATVYRRTSASISAFVASVPSSAAVNSERDTRRKLVDEAPVGLLPDGTEVRQFERDPRGRVVGFTAMDKTRWVDAGTNGFERDLDTSVMPLALVDQAYVPGIGDVSDAGTCGAGRVQTATSPRGAYAAAPWGLLGLAGPPQNAFDLIVYGANLSGTAAALAAARAGYRVCVLEPTGFVGGVIAAGLAYQDYPIGNRRNELVWGICRELLSAVAPYNIARVLAAGETNATILNEFRGGPQVRIMPDEFRREVEAALNEAGVVVRLNTRIDAPRHVQRAGKRITGIVTSAGLLTAAYFSECSYTGDLMRHAGAATRKGRESASAYGETGAGFRRNNARTSGTFSAGVFSRPISPVDLVDPGTAHGAADDSCMAMDFRGVMTQEGNRIPWPMPAGYNRLDFVALAEQINSGGETAFVSALAAFDTGTGGRFHAYDLRQVSRVNWNSNPILSISFAGTRSRKYRDGIWADRDAIEAEIAYWTQGTFYFLANDPSVPEAIRLKAQSWGLPADQFRDSPFGVGFPHAPYVRAGLRLIGAETLTGLDQQLTVAAPKTKRVASFIYAQDSKFCNAWVAPNGTSVLEEGYIGAPDPTIPFDVTPEMMMEAAGGLENLLVGNLISCTSVAWTAVRLEALQGMMGEVNGTIAAQCLDRFGQAVQAYDYADLRTRLIRSGFNL